MTELMDSIKAEMARQKNYATGDDDWSIASLVNGSVTVEWNAKEKRLLVRIHEKSSTGDVLFKFKTSGERIVMTRPDMKDIRTYNPMENPFGI